MAIDKLSISMDRSITDIIRRAAMEEGVSVSAWLSDAAQDRIRNRSLRNALDVDEPEIAALSDSELQVLVDRARANIVVTKPKRSTNSEAPGAEAA